MDIRILAIDDLDAQIALQARVIETLNNDFFIRNRSDEYWKNVLESRDYVVYGIFDGDLLVSSATIHFPNGVDVRDMPEFSPVPDTELAIFQSVMVDKKYRGFGFMRILQDMRQGAAIKRKRGKIICKISAENLASWKNAINYGFHCVHVKADDTGHDKMYFIKKLHLTQGFITK